MDQKNITKFKNVGVNIFLFILAIALIVFAIRQQIGEKDKNSNLTEEISQKVVQEIKNESSSSTNNNPEFSDFQSLASLKKLTIVNNFESWTPSAEIDNNKLMKKIILKKGELSKGYLYIKVSINNSPLTTWESIYIKLNNEGGHLFRPNSLKIPNPKTTEILFPLDNIYYLESVPYSEKAIPKSVNWFNLLKDKKELELLTFISSLKPATIEEISFYYDCKIESDCILDVK